LSYRYIGYFYYIKLRKTMSHEKFTTTELEKKAEQIMNSFDFEKVHAHMVAADWKWSNRDDSASEVPTVDRVKTIARYLLTNVIWDTRPVINCSTGGFAAYKLPWGLQLHFTLTNSHA